MNRHVLRFVVVMLQPVGLPSDQLFLSLTRKSYRSSGNPRIRWPRDFRVSDFFANGTKWLRRIFGCISRIWKGENSVAWNLWIWIWWGLGIRVKVFLVMWKTGFPICCIIEGHQQWVPFQCIWMVDLMRIFWRSGRICLEGWNFRNAMFGSFGRRQLTNWPGRLVLVFCFTNIFIINIFLAKFVIFKVFLRFICLC